MCIASSLRKRGDLRYPTFWVDVTIARSCTHSPQTRSRNKMVLFNGAIFEISPGHRKPRIYIYLFIAEVLQITSRFVLVRNYCGVRCTLNWIYTLSCLKQPLPCLNPNDIFHDCEEKFNELICDNKETLLSSHQVRSPSYIVMFWLPVWSWLGPVPWFWFPDLFRNQLICSFCDVKILRHPQ